MTRTAAITGAASGIGQATCRRLPGVRPGIPYGIPLGIPLGIPHAQNR